MTPTALRQLRRALAGGTLVALGAAPYLAEAHAGLEARRAITCGGSCGTVGAMDVELDGLRLQDVHTRRHGASVVARTVDVRVGWDGVTVDIDGLEATVDPEAFESSREPSAPTEQAPTPAPSPATSSTSPRRLPFPILVRARGTASVETRGIRLTVSDPSLAVAPDGDMAATFQASVSGRGLSVSSRGAMRALVPAGRRELHLAGALAQPDGRDLPITAHVSKKAVTMELGDETVGTATVHADPVQKSLVVHARDLSLAMADPLARGLPGDVTIELAGATMTGRVDLIRRDGGYHLGMEGVQIAGVELQESHVSRHPIALDSLTVDGDAWARDGAVGGQAVVGHREAQARIAGEVRPDRVALDLSLPETSCQTLLDSVPDGATDMLRGMGLGGTVAGRLELSFDPRTVGDAPGAAADGSWTPPGTLELDFPFIDNCRVEREPPRVDLAGLTGPYRHQFRTDGGQTRERLLTAGAPGFVSLDRVELVADAFVTLEDTRFWEHDGFDRQQIEKAFWHNLGAGGFRRGASTITQQTARNLWLGIDRSVARKLQEALLASRLEANVDKRRILELYVNLIELGPEVHGVFEAARYHFGKRPEDLSVLESLYIASLAPAPRTLSLRHHRDGIPTAWMDHLHEQARRMHIHGHISWSQYRQALRQELRLVSGEPPA